MRLVEDDRAAAPALDDDALPAGWGEWISAEAAARGCPRDYVAAGLIVAASAWIGNSRHVAVTATWSEPPHLWLAAIDLAEGTHAIEQHNGAMRCGRRRKPTSRFPIDRRGPTRRRSRRDRAFWRWTRPLPLSYPPGRSGYIDALLTPLTLRASRNRPVGGCLTLPESAPKS
jgi:hypothetical protein